MSFINFTWTTIPALVYRVLWSVLSVLTLTDRWDQSNFIVTIWPTFCVCFQIHHCVYIYIYICVTCFVPQVVSPPRRSEAPPFLQGGGAWQEMPVTTASAGNCQYASAGNHQWWAPLVWGVRRPLLGGGAWQDRPVTTGSSNIPVLATQGWPFWVIYMYIYTVVISYTCIYIHIPPHFIYVFYI